MDKVLIVEDEKAIIELLSIHLQDLNKVVESATDGLDGLTMALKNSYQLIVLDVMLPGKTGLEICNEIRRNNITTPILMLTAKSEEIDKLLGLEIGADDYLTKPFSIHEFIARVKSLLRRSSSYNQQNEPAKLLIKQELSIETEKRRLLKNGIKVELTPKEFDLLYLLASNPGKSYTRANLLNIVWGYDFTGYEHTVNSHINRLRAKIENDPDQPIYIKTVWGIGYAFTDEF